MDNKDFLLILSGAVILYLLRGKKEPPQQASKTVTLENNASAQIDNGDQYKLCIYSKQPIKPQLIKKNIADGVAPSSQIRLEATVLDRKIISGIPQTI
jgi:hypothetical protein